MLKPLRNLSLIFAGAYLRWRGFMGDSAEAQTGLRSCVFSLLMPALALRDTWKAEYDMTFATLIGWTLLIHTSWVCLVYAGVRRLAEQGLLPAVPAQGWYFVAACGSAVGIAVAMLHSPRAVAAAMLFDVGSNTWICQVGLAVLGRLAPAGAAGGRGGHGSARVAEAESIEMTVVAPLPAGTAADEPGVGSGVAKRSAAQGTLPGPSGSATALEEDLKARDPEGERQPGTGEILFQLVLKSPIMNAFIVGMSMNALGVPIPAFLDDLCAHLSDAFGCMVFVLVGACLELRAPTWGALRPILTALGLRLAVQAVLTLVFPVILMRLSGVACEFRRAFVMCMLCPSTNMVIYWTDVQHHPTETTALYLTMSMVVGVGNLTLVSMALHGDGSSCDM